VSRADQIIRALKLKPHPEGGHFRETFRDGAGANARAHSTAIYYLLKKHEVSRWHRIDAAEVWHFYTGSALELYVRQGSGQPNRLVLGRVLETGQRPQIIVPAGVWQCARSLGAYTLTGCTVAPGFLLERLELES
jgi:predicted cupin superfamily sugar epimerase